MPTDAAYSESTAPSAMPIRDSGLSAGAGIALAVLIGSLMWVGLFAMIL